MSETRDASTSDLLTLTAQIVSAHVRNNSVPAEALPALILTVRDALASAGQPQGAEPAAPQQQPAVSIKRSIQPDFLICLEDGAKVTMLKRYLRRFGLEPDEYRAKWGLPSDYPMVAPNYAARRSTLAKELGLGRKRAPVEAAEGDDAADMTDTMEAPVFAADVADEAKSRKHTAQSVFANFGTGEQPDVDQDEPADKAAATPRKRGRKPFAEQSVRSGRGRRASARD